MEKPASPAVSRLLWGGAALLFMIAVGGELGWLTGADLVGPLPKPAISAGGGASVPPVAPPARSQADTIAAIAKAEGITLPPPGTSPLAAAEPKTAPPPAPPPRHAEARRAGDWLLQLAAFRNRVNAERLAARVRRTGFACHIQHRGSLATVYAGPFVSRAETLRAARELRVRTGLHARLIHLHGETADKRRSHDLPARKGKIALNRK